MKRKKNHYGRTPRDMLKRLNERGFSIIEVMIAISILSIGILALASMQVAAMRGNSFAGSVTEGSTWALDQIEKLMNLPWDDASLEDADLDGGAGLANIGFDNNPSTQADADFMIIRGRYAIHWNVANNVVTANTRTVNVIVTWSDHGVQKSVSIRRVLARII
jgi:type IV pilus assembly protein PilV